MASVSISYILLTYNQRDTYMPDLLICRTAWADRVLEEVARLG